MLDMVSIILPTYNRASVLGRAVASVIAQTWKNWELLIIDDGSLDETQTLIQHFKSQDERIQFIQQVENRGAGVARNVGILHATGDVIAFLDSDDEWLPNKLELQLNFLNEHPHLSACCTGFAIERGGQLPDFRFGPQIHHWRHFLCQGSSIAPGTTLMVRRVCFEQTGLFDTRLQRLEDWEWLLRFITRYQIGALSDILATIYRGPKPSVASLKVAVGIFKGLLQEHRGLTETEKKQVRAVLNLEIAAAHWAHKSYTKALLKTAWQSLYAPKVSLQYLQRYLSRWAIQKASPALLEAKFVDPSIVKVGPRHLNPYLPPEVPDTAVQRALDYLLYYEERQAMVGRAHALCSQLARQSAQHRSIDWQGRPLYLQSDLELPFQTTVNCPIPEAISGWQAKTERPLAVVNVAKPESDIHLEVMRLPLDRLPIVFSPAGALVQNEIWYQTALSALSQQRISFVYQQYQWGHFSGVQLAQALAKPLILEYAGRANISYGLDGRYQTLAQRIQDLNLAKADLLIVPNDDVFNELTEAGVEEARIFINPPGIDEKIYHPGVGSPELRERLELNNCFIIGLLGSNSTEADDQELVQALEIILQNHGSTVHLLWLGQADSLSHRPLNKFLSQYAAQVSYHAIETAIGLAEYLALCDMYLVPNVLAMKQPGDRALWPSWAELMALGRPIISEPTSQPFLVHNLSAWLLSSKTASQWRQAIEQLLSQQDLRAALGDASYKTSERLYSWQAHGSRLHQRLQDFEASNN